MDSYRRGRKSVVNDSGMTTWPQCAESLGSMGTNDSVHRWMETVSGSP